MGYSSLAWHSLALAGLPFSAACSPASGPVPVVVVHDGGTAEDTGAQKPADGGTNSGACGLVFYGTGYPAACQTLLDRACCADERACAGIATCIGFVECEDACPDPKEESCLETCAAMNPAGSPGSAAFEALASCGRSRGTPDSGPAKQCDWPD